MGRHASDRPARRPWLPAVLTGSVLVVATAVLVPVLGSGDRSDAVSPGPGPVGSELTLAVGGSVSFAGRTLPLLADAAGPFPGVRELLTGADLAVVDLDGALPADPRAAAALSGAGVDLVALTATPDAETTTATLEALTAAGLRPVGAGGTAVSAASPQRLEVAGQGVTVLALSLAPGGVAAGPSSAGLATTTEADAVLAAAGVAERQGDLVVVRVSGAEPCGEDTTALVARLTGAGADLVVGAGDVPGGAWTTAGGHRAWVAPSPGPLLSADETGPTATGVLLLTARGGAVTGGSLATGRVDAFGRVQDVMQPTTTAERPGAPPGGPCAGPAPPAAGG